VKRQQGGYSMSLVDRLLSRGSGKDDDIQRIRLTRQVNGLNIFYTFLAGLAALLLGSYVEGSGLLVGIQVAAALIYLLNLILIGRGMLDKVRVLTIYVFEIQMFLDMCLTNAWDSRINFVVILYPLLAALAEDSRFKHLAVSLVQVISIIGLHFLFPAFESRLLSISRLEAGAANVVSVMGLVFFPIMAAVIIELIFRENLRAREKQKEMLEEIRLSNKKLEVYADRLKDESLRLQAEVNIARQIQTMVLPSDEEIQAISELDIACIMRTADEVGGDYYDVIKIDDTVTIGIGDVTGHGLSSGIIMLMAQTVIRTLAELRITDPMRFLGLVNKVLYANIRRIREDRNMTLALVTYRNGECVASGQHESIILQRADGRAEVIDTLNMGFYIGLMEDVEEQLGKAEFRLGPGDFMLLYSDGITEAMDRDGRQFGLERLCDAAKKYSCFPAKKIVAKVIKDVYNHMGEKEIGDDISLVVVKQR